jgi:hypothetical protein
VTGPTRLDQVVPAFSVTCRTCYRMMWQGDVAPADGQTLLTAYADSTQGTVCPSGVDGCPHKAAAIAAAKLLQPVTLADLTAVKGRLDKLEAKSKA